MEEIKQMLSAIIERLDVESAKNEAFQVEMRAFRTEMSQDMTEVLTQMDYLAGKLGQHERDLHVIKQKNG